MNLSFPLPPQTMNKINQKQKNYTLYDPIYIKQAKLAYAIRNQLGGWLPLGRHKEDF